MNTWTMNLQNSSSPNYDLMIFFHDFTMIILIFITTLIFLIMTLMILSTYTNRFLLQGHTMEMIWTILPMFILIFIAIPSLKILYLTDETHDCLLTMKAIGHQWYWSYEYSDFMKIEFDSFMIPLSQLSPYEFRLLDVDNRCILPFNLPIRILTTSMDVIHAWTIPSLGIKMDSTPGRLNQTMMTICRPGLYFGQCSEICGLNHSFMPIVIEATNLSNFNSWMLINHTS